MNTTKCPSCEGRFYLPDKSTLNGRLRCPLCNGHGTIPMTLPIPHEPRLVSSDFGLTRGKYWREMSRVGSLHGLPVAGKAVATDGVLVILELPDGNKFIGHLANFVPVSEPRKPGERKAREDVNANLFE